MKYAFINGVLLDGNEDMVPQRDRVIFTDGEWIERLGNAGCETTGYSVIDLQGKYILPGLINLHVHLAGSGKPKNNSADARRLVKLITGNALTNALGHALVKSYAKTQLMSGTTTIRTVGGITNYDTTIRDKINAGKCVGPRILASNMAISVPGGHMAGSLAHEAHTPEEAAAFVDLVAKDKPDLIKLMITGGVSDAEKVGEPGVLRMQPEIVRAACERAHALGFTVAAHVESPEGVKVALENGVDSIEHGAAPSRELTELYRNGRSFHVATISPALPFALFDKSAIPGMTDAMQENGKIVFDGVVDMAKDCLKNGIPVGLGTDTACPYVTQYDMWRELAYFVKFCGVSNAFAIYTATKRNAELAGVGDVTGSIEPGKSADMITVEGNPLEDISVLRDVKQVVMAGRVYDARVKKIDIVEKMLEPYWR